MSRIFAVLVCLCILTACGPKRAPVPPGVVPEQTEVSAEDENYGHEVLNDLMDRYQLDNNDQRINRVRDIANRLTEAKNPNGNPWHIYLLKDDTFKNAAATRGNYIFVWTGILGTVKDDDELATILAHEIGHVLAGHTAPDPSEEVSRMISGIAGTAAGHIVAAQGSVGILADLADMLIRSSIEALLVNPDLKVKESEADQVGLFLMADAGFDPAKAVKFWERLKDDPEFSGFPIAFLSSHPSSEDRFHALEKLLPEAEQRYQAKRSGKSFVTSEERNNFVVSQKEVSSRKETWVVLEPNVDVLKKPQSGSPKVGNLNVGTKVTVLSHKGPWLEISEPVSGFVRGTDLTPFRPQQDRSDFAR